MQKITFTFLVVLMAGAFSVSAQQTRIDVQKGQKYQVETSVKMTNTAEVMGQSMENNIDSKTTTIYEVMNTGADSVYLQSTVTKLVVNATMMGQEANFDSDKKDNEGPMAELLSKMVNKVKAMTLDVKGNITKQDENEDDFQNPLMGGSMGNGTTTELFIPALIGKELKTGDSIIDVGSVKKEKFNSADSGTYKITAIENGVASVSYSGTQILSVVMEQMGMEMTSNSNSLVNSELQVDTKTGMVLAKATVMESTVSVDAGGMTIPAIGKTITTIKISPVQ
jgi:hypothetical protein